MIMKKLFISFAILTYSFNAYAGFKSNDWVDEMNDTKVYSKYTRVKTSGYKNYQTLGFECRIENGKKTGRMSIEFDGSESIATPNSSIDFRIRVDKGEVYRLKGRMYSNSYRGGLVKVVPDELYSELKSGSKAFIEIWDSRELEVRQSFSLSGSTKAINYISSKCGLSVGLSDEVLSKRNEINDKYDKMIKDIERKREKELSQIK
jgi:WD40 repeat protein